jgi:hypothetical protein
VVERVEEEEDPVLIFTAQKSIKQPASLILITGGKFRSVFQLRVVHMDEIWPEWLERLTANAKVETVFSPAFSDTVESEGRQMKQC